MELPTTTSVLFGDVPHRKKLDDLDKTNKKSHGTIPLVEKYRPRKLDDIIEQEEAIKVLKGAVRTGELPHLLLFGPAGTGKTSSIMALAYELFGPDLIHERVMELNASDDRGISIVRNKILTFAKFSIGGKDPRFPCPNFKLVILDEADAMTPDAQAALRKVMEENSATTRFCFICNYVAKIIDPVSSRCTKFRFKPIEKAPIIEKLKIIAKNENITIPANCFDTIYDISDGDARMAIMVLQNLKYVINYKGAITSEDVLSITGGIDEKALIHFWDKCMTGSLLDMRQLALFVMREGFHAGNILLYLAKNAHGSKISDYAKGQIMIHIANTDKNLLDGGNEYMQMLNLLVQTNIILRKDNSK